MIISLIAAVDEANGMGVNNQLLCHLPADLQHFKQLTMSKPILMGRATFDSIGKPLPGRLNIVLSRSLSPIAGVLVFDSLKNALASQSAVDELMIIGGAQLFAQTLAMANHIYLTKIHHLFKADVFFPTIDEQQWHCQSKDFRPHDEKNSYDMTFYRYDRILASR